MSEPQQIRALLVEIRGELRRLDLWEPAPPSPQQLSSTAPFCFDTLEFPQWLQWIFLPRTQAVLDAGGSPPAASNIAPMAAWYVEQSELEGAARLVRLIERFDALAGDWGQ